MPSKPNGTPTSPGETPATVEEKAAATLGTTASRAARSASGRRELMLQEVLRIHQKAIANLAEDIAYFGDQLVELTRDVVRNQLVIRTSPAK